MGTRAVVQQHVQGSFSGRMPAQSRGLLLVMREMLAGMTLCIQRWLGCQFMDATHHGNQRLCGDAQHHGQQQGHAQRAALGSGSHALDVNPALPGW